MSWYAANSDVEAKLREQNQQLQQALDELHSEFVRQQQKHAEEWKTALEPSQVARALVLLKADEAFQIIERWAKNEGLLAKLIDRLQSKEQGKGE